MLLLTATTNILRLISSSTATTDVTAHYVDKSGTTITEGTELTPISTATTTTILPAPASSTSRAVKALSIRNRHATTAQTITLQLYNGTTAFDLWNCTLSAGWALHYADGRGFYAVDSQGREIVNTAANAIGPAVNTINLVVLASDVVNNNAVANTIADVTGLLFPVVSGETYQFNFQIAYTSAATTTGSRWAVTVPTGTLYMRQQYSLTTGSITVVEGTSAGDIPAAANATSIVAANIASMDGMFVAGANGNVQARFASEVAGSAITARAGSYVQWVRVL